MPPAKVGVDSRAAQLIGFPRKFMVSLTCPTYEIANTAPKERSGPYGLKTKTKTKNPQLHAQVKINCPLKPLEWKHVLALYLCQSYCVVRKILLPIRKPRLVFLA